MGRDDQKVDPGLDTVPALDWEGGATAAGWSPGQPRPAQNGHAGHRALENYRILEVLGEGGMGTVYLAQQDQPIRRQVALKVLNTRDPTEHALRRFEAERQALALMNHPNIAQVYDAGRTESGAPFFAMERVDGVPIDVYCDQDGLDIRRRLELMIKVCEGVQHAHQKGIIHRDIKPSNVMVTGDAERPEPKIIDFGVAKALDEPLTDQNIETGPGILGTVLFMAPEQFRKDEHGDVDTRADIYSLGVLLFQLMVGELPITASSRESVFDLAERILVETPHPPSTVMTQVDSKAADRLEEARNTEWATLTRQIKGDLDWITLKAMEKDRTRRYDSAAEMAADLRRYLRDEPVLATPPSLTYRTGKFVRRNSRVLAVTGVALAALIAVSGAGIRAQLQANTRAALAQEFGGQVKSMESLMRIARLTPRHDVTAEMAIIRERMNRLRNRVEQLGEIAEGPGFYALGRGHMELGEVTEARSNLEKAWSLGYREPEVAYALAMVMADLYLVGVNEAQKIKDEGAREKRLRELEREYRDPALGYVELSEGVELESAEYIEAQVAMLERRYVEALNKARVAREKIPWLYEAQTLEGSIHVIMARQSVRGHSEHNPIDAIRQAESSFEEAIKVGESDVRIYSALCDALSFRMQLEIYGRNKDVSSHFRRGVRACGQALEVDPENLSARRGKLVLLQRMGEFEMNAGGDPGPYFRDAEVLIQEALALGPDDRAFLYDLGVTQLYLTYYASRRGEDISKSAAAAIEALEKVHTLDPSAHGVLNNLGIVYYLLAGDEQARGKDPRPSIEMAIDWMERSLEIKPDAVYSLNNLGDALRLLAGEQIDSGEDPEASLLKAIEAHRRAAEIKPDHIDAYMDGAADHERLAAHRISTGGDPGDHLEIAAELVGQAIELNPDAWEVHRNLGDVHRTDARYRILRGEDPGDALSAAADAYERAHHANPNIYPGSQGIAEILTIRARYDLDRGVDPRPTIARAEAWINTAIELDPSNGTPIFYLVEVHDVAARWLLARGNNPDDEIAAAFQAVAEMQRIGGEESGWGTLGDLYLLRAETKMARDISPADDLAAGLRSVDASLGVNPRKAGTWATRGELRLMQARTSGDLQIAGDAVDSLERAIAINAHLDHGLTPNLEEARTLAGDEPD